MSTLALDLGTKLGWAVDMAGTVRSGTHSFAPEGHERDGWRFQRFRSWLADNKQWLRSRGTPLTRVVYERVDFIVPGQVYSAQVWAGMWAHLTAWCEHHNLDYEGIAVGTIKRAVAGSGRAKKPAIIAAVRARGFKVASSDEADAIAVLLTAQALELERAA